MRIDQNVYSALGLNDFTALLSCMASDRSGWIMGSYKICLWNGFSKCRFQFSIGLIIDLLV